MKNKTKTLIRNIAAIIIVFVGVFPTLNAQVYNSAIGVRVGYPLSITYKKNTSAKGL